MKDNSEMTKEELIALGWVKNPLDKMQEKTEKQLTAVEWLLSELKKYGDECPKYELNYVIEVPKHILTELEEQAKEMEKEQKIEFACAVYDKYNFGPQEISFRGECEQFKSE